MAIGDVTRITAQFSSTAGDIFQWVYHYVQTTGTAILPADIAIAAAAKLALCWAEIEGSVHTSVGGDTLEVAVFDSGSGSFDTVETIGIPTLLGTNSGSEPVNFQDAPVVKFFTNVGRSIGKKFLFGLVKDAFTGQSPTAGVLAAMAAFALELNDDISPTGGTLAPGNFNVPTAVFREWSNTIEANLLTGTQDRRRRGIGL